MLNVLQYFCKHLARIVMTERIFRNVLNGRIVQEIFFVQERRMFLLNYGSDRKLQKQLDALHK